MGCSPEPSVTFVPDPLRTQPCPGQDHAFVQSHCGRYYPDAEQPAVYIPFAVLTPQLQEVKALGDKAMGLSPVVFFSGGPGEGGNTLAAKLDHWRYWMLDAGIKRPLILWDSRGNEGAWGYFQCESYRLWALNQLRYAEHGQGDELAKVKACLKQWRTQLSNTGFEQFNAQRSAQDIVTLLLQLGHEQWHMMATSYGSRVAQAAVALEPARAQSLLLDSPYSWAVNSRLAHSQRWVAGFRRILAWCQARQSCHQGESVEPLFWQAIAALEAKSATVKFRLEGYHHQAQVDANLFVHLLFSTFYYPQSLSQEAFAEARYTQLVPLLKQVVKGDWAHLQLMAGPLLSQSYSSAANTWLYWAAECNDNQVLSEREYQQGVAKLGVWARFFAPDMSLLICAQLNGLVASQAPLSLQAPSSVPALVLTGELDPVVSLKDVKQLLEPLSTHMIVSAVAHGHGVLAEDTCSSAWLPEYWASPKAFIENWIAKADASHGTVPFPNAGQKASPCRLEY